MWTFIKKQFGIHIPRKKVCADHDAPMDALYEAFMGYSKVFLWLANRSGGKTMDLAILSCLDSLANDHCESANLGAIQAQAQRCYRYMQTIMNSSMSFKGFVNGVPTIKRTDFINKSSIEVLVATITGVNSPHPQKLKMDEIELIPWIILQEAFSMVQSKGDTRGVTVLGSTRKFASGPMQKLVDTSDGKGIKVFKWCILEVLEAFPTDPAMQKKIRSTLGNDLPANVDDFDGYYKWEDFLEKYATIDRDVIETQWFSKKPDLAALVYSRFSEITNIEYKFEIDKQKQHYIFEDFGNSKDHPDVILFVELDPETQTVTVFDELYQADIASNKMVLAAAQKWREWGLTVTWESDDKGNPTMFNFEDLDGWVPDHHMLTQVIDRKNMGLPIMEKVTDDQVEPGQVASQLYLIQNGIHVVRKFLDDAKLKITQNCKQLREEFLTYSRKKKASTGEYMDEAEKKYDHGPDAIRYGLITLFPAIALGTFGNQALPETSKPILTEAQSDNVEEYFDDPDDGDGTLTDNMMRTAF